jgi:hypothetical protein
MNAFLLFFLVMLPVVGAAQNPIPDTDSALKRQVEESLLNEPSSTQIILDNTRTKVGKDFYELFYKHLTAIPTQVDTTRADTVRQVMVGAILVIMVEEIPIRGTTSQVLISIGDQPVFQQFVQARYELLEADALYAVETVRDYLKSYQEMLQLLGSQDQKGSGVY